MAKCPNCGLKTARTEDWCCQWCGYPLLYGPYKKIEKTYRELKEERLAQQPPVEEAEPEAASVLEPEPELELEPELEPEAVPEPIPEPEPAAKPKPMAKREQTAKNKSATEPEPKTKIKSAAKAEPTPETAVEPEPVLEAEPEPVPAAIEITVAELLSAYEAEGEAADARFANQIIRITGVVGRIEIKDTLDIYYITLKSAGKTLLLQNVRCVFGRKYGPELSQLTTGQTVTVQGKYDGSVIDLSLRDCILVR